MEPQRNRPRPHPTAFSVHRVAYGLPSGAAANRISDAVRACSAATTSPGLLLRGPKPGSVSPSIPRGGRNPGMAGGCVTADMAEPPRYGFAKDPPCAKREGGAM